MATPLDPPGDPGVTKDTVMPRSLVSDGKIRARSRKRVERDHLHYGTHFALAIAGAVLFFVAIAVVTRII